MEQLIVDCRICLRHSINNTLVCDNCRDLERKADELFKHARNSPNVFEHLKKNDDLYQKIIEQRKLFPKCWMPNDRDDAGCRQKEKGK